MVLRTLEKFVEMYEIYLMGSHVTSKYCGNNFLKKIKQKKIKEMEKEKKIKGKKGKGKERKKEGKVKAKYFFLTNGNLQLCSIASRQHTAATRSNRYHTTIELKRGHDRTAKTPRLNLKDAMIEPQRQRDGTVKTPRLNCKDSTMERHD
jgi:hypothetical protein